MKVTTYVQEGGVVLHRCGYGFPGLFHDLPAQLAPERRQVALVNVPWHGTRHLVPQLVPVPVAGIHTQCNNPHFPGVWEASDDQGSWIVPRTVLFGGLQ